MHSAGLILGVLYLCWIWSLPSRAIGERMRSGRERRLVFENGVDECVRDGLGRFTGVPGEAQMRQHLPQWSRSRRSRGLAYSYLGSAHPPSLAAPKSRQEIRSKHLSHKLLTFMMASPGRLLTNAASPRTHRTWRKRTHPDFTMLATRFRVAATQLRKPRPLFRAVSTLSSNPDIVCLPPPNSLHTVAHRNLALPRRA